MCSRGAVCKVVHRVSGGAPWLCAWLCAWQPRAAAPLACHTLFLNRASSAASAGAWDAHAGSFVPVPCTPNAVAAEARARAVRVVSFVRCVCWCTRAGAWDTCCARRVVCSSALHTQCSCCCLHKLACQAVAAVPHSSWDGSTTTTTCSALYHGSRHHTLLLLALTPASIYPAGAAAGAGPWSSCSQLQPRHLCSTR